MRQTQFAFGVAGGINAPVPEPLGPGNTFKYTGQGVYEVNLDFDKVLGIPQGSLLVRLEQWYGEYGNISLHTGAFSPTVEAAMLPPSPDNQGLPLLTNCLWTRPVTERLTLFAGKTTALGAFDQGIFSGGDGTDRFANLALVGNPALLLGIPYSFITLGVTCPRDWGGFGVYVIDPDDDTRNVFGDGDLFSRGVIVGSELRMITTFFGQTSRHHLGAFWKHVPLTNLRFQEPPPGLYPEPTVPGAPTLNDSYTLYYGFDHYLMHFGDEGRGWGLFGRASLSDGNPTPVLYFLSAGLGGHSPWQHARGDTFGIGWYFVGASNQFGPVPQALYGPRDGTGLELYYNFQVRSWLTVTPDFQWLRPEASAIAEDAVVGGVRVRMLF